MKRTLLSMALLSAMAVMSSGATAVTLDSVNTFNDVTGTTKEIVTPNTEIDFSQTYEGLYVEEETVEIDTNGSTLNLWKEPEQQDFLVVLSNSDLTFTGNLSAGTLNANSEMMLGILQQDGNSSFNGDVTLDFGVDGDTSLGIGMMLMGTSEEAVAEMDINGKLKFDIAVNKPSEMRMDETSAGIYANYADLNIKNIEGSIISGTGATQNPIGIGTSASTVVIDQGKLDVIGYGNVKGVRTLEASNVTLKDLVITVSGISNNTSSEVIGIDSYSSTVNIGSSSIISNANGKNISSVGISVIDSQLISGQGASISAEGKTGASATGISITSNNAESVVNLEGGSIDVKSNANSTGIQIEGGTNDNVTFTTRNESITVSTTGDSVTYAEAKGMAVEAGQNAMLETTVITVSSKNGAAYGITTESLSGPSLVKVKNSQITATSTENKSYGVSLFASKSEVIFLDSNNIKADVALNLVEESAINVGSTEVKGSVLNVDGLITSQGTMNLTDATLNVVGGQTAQSTLGKVNTLGKGESKIALAAGDYKIDSLTGEKKSIVFNDLANTKGVAIADKKGDLLVVATTESNDQYKSAEEAAQALVDKVSVKNDEDTAKNQILVEDGGVNDRLSATVNRDGTLSDVQITKNTKLDAFASVNALSAMTLRHEMNSLSKRMGELRDSPAGVGAWVRAYGSEMEYGAQNITAKNTSIQVGSDYSIGDWKVGAAFTYTDGESTYDLGSTDNKGYGFALYGTWFVPCGAYVDLMAKYNRLDNDFALNGMNGSVKNDAFGFSVETGYRFNFLNDGLFVEPQIGLSYGQIKGETVKTSNGVTLAQDDYDSLIGRVGVRTGFKFPKDKGNIYARVSGVYDFEGEMNGKATLDKASNTFEADLGGAWLEVGVGANFNMTKHTYTYIDLERTNGGHVKENYRWNIGVRHVF